MAVGLPGQGKHSSIASIQPPLAVPQPAPNARPMHSVAGPQERRGQGKTRKRNRTKAKGDSGSRTALDESGRQSSDSESSSTSGSEGSLLRWAGLEGGGHSHKGKDWSYGRKGVSSSEGEVSDGDAGSAKLKSVLSNVRHQALSCLTMVFQVSDCTVRLKALLSCSANTKPEDKDYSATILQMQNRHTAFSYWLSFLPDGPRPPNSPPLLLTCLLKDPVPKVPLH